MSTKRLLERIARAQAEAQILKFPVRRTKAYRDFKRRARSANKGLLGKLVKKAKFLLLGPQKCKKGEKMVFGKCRKYTPYKPGVVLQFRRPE